MTLTQELSKQKRIARRLERKANRVFAEQEIASGLDDMLPLDKYDVWTEEAFSHDLDCYSADMCKQPEAKSFLSETLVRRFQEP